MRRLDVRGMGLRTRLLIAFALLTGMLVLVWVSWVHYNQQQRLQFAASQDTRLISRVVVHELEQANQALIDHAQLAAVELENYPDVPDDWLPLAGSLSDDLWAWYDASGQLRGSWGESLPAGLRDRPVAVQAALVTQKPLDWIACTPQCHSYAAVPVRLGHQTQVILIAQRLERVLSAVAQLTDTQLRLDHLGQSLLARGEMPPPGRTRLLRLDVAGLPTGMTLTAAQDASAEQLRTQTVRQGLHALAGLTWLLAVILVAGILHGPLRRLQCVTRFLTRVEGQQWRDLPQAWQAMNQRVGAARDETGDLARQAGHLAQFLQTLDQQVAERDQMIQAHLAMIAADRDFLRAVLDGVEALIFVSDDTGAIQLANRPALQMLGFDQIDGQDLTQWVLDADSPAHEFRQLMAVLGGQQTSCTYECELLDATGEAHDLRWLHLNLPAGHNQAPACLSIGTDLTREREAREMASMVTQIDPLTGALRRRQFLRQIARSGPQPATLLLVALDGLPRLRAAGLLAEEAALTDFARQVFVLLGSGGQLGRLAGDLWGILLTGPAPDAGKLAARLPGCWPQGLRVVVQQGPADRSLVDAGLARLTQIDCEVA